MINMFELVLAMGITDKDSIEEMKGIATGQHFYSVDNVQSIMNITDEIINDSCKASMYRFLRIYRV